MYFHTLRNAGVKKCVLKREKNRKAYVGVYDENDEVSGKKYDRIIVQQQQFFKIACWWKSARLHQISLTPSVHC